ncbi:flavin reductase (DIM6/NTAB) family NADH-FMN oxidoreductase RutF [Streptomonospora nanhaiensis]|uniref:Flavin reductase (DIM6/NTAB) family NADH-FMN oxidoreductase RutF n=2 Tax=Streptomonospora nanhaiensis TaxID=1323731 RepID=A0A853BMI0_9ACTN|nr:flavin reductase (DIM6/NTAB) family NADH-FMN oxidoreductase RutF [Streptomonospora nanhaiensis]
MSGAAPSVAPAAYTETMARFATGVTVLTVRDDRDDIGSTVSAFTSVSADPPSVLVGLAAHSYLCEVLDAQGAFAVSVLAADQRALAGRFAAEGRPSARLLLAEEPHRRGERTGALVLEDAVAALECVVAQRVPAGDHVLYIAEVAGLPDVGRGRADQAGPLLRFGGRYRTLG